MGFILVYVRSFRGEQPWGSIAACDWIILPCIKHTRVAESHETMIHQGCTTHKRRPWCMMDAHFGRKGRALGSSVQALLDTLAGRSTANLAIVVIWMSSFMQRLFTG